MCEPEHPPALAFGPHKGSVHRDRLLLPREALFSTTGIKEGIGTCPASSSPKPPTGQPSKFNPTPDVPLFPWKDARGAPARSAISGRISALPSRRLTCLSRATLSHSRSCRAERSCNNSARSWSISKGGGERGGDKLSPAAGCPSWWPRCLPATVISQHFLLKGRLPLYTEAPSTLRRQWESKAGPEEHPCDLRGPDQADVLGNSP